MKKLIILIILPILVLFFGCSKNNTNLSDKDKGNEAPVTDDNNIVKNQKYSFGPMADASKIDDETKRYLQDFLNKLGDPTKDKITFEVMRTKYESDGSLMVDIFIRNGNPETVFNIDTTLQLIENDVVIATADFKFTLEDFGKLPKDTSRPWTILYFPEDMKNKDIKIKNPIIKSTKCEYEF
ncbi:hypothetical protein CLHOM_32110 [Clostridium homopropionicum DSM 5847]|uniref:SLAP domain-containing protein n=1 Tax=Clostridium homopropionicum DSM 5847 TaxID=1121318 RepID=A0A0L6Z5S2_9CLOT|nr:SLAP domain-containing protein [Clostridium homopropionicum]KOA18314.1 hypothetical protein CLHOM_32110 [Clostridium homopropionicum DSM 5847]SFF69304.1 SLAP domain-containing protein [Clostridium homopropionicum]